MEKRNHVQLYYSLISEHQVNIGNDKSKTGQQHYNL